MLDKARRKCREAHFVKPVLGAEQASRKKAMGSCAFLANWPHGTARSADMTDRIKGGNMHKTTENIETEKMPTLPIHRFSADREHIVGLLVDSTVLHSAATEMIRAGTRILDESSGSSRRA